MFPPVQRIGFGAMQLPHRGRATELTEMAWVQNAFNLVDRSSAEVMAACE